MVSFTCERISAIKPRLGIPEGRIAQKLFSVSTLVALRREWGQKDRRKS
jgi:hypothetical protein